MNGTWIRAVGGALAVLLVFLAVGGVWGWKALYDDREGAVGTVPFVVHEGETLRETADRLTVAGLLDAPWTLRAVARIEGGARGVRSGEYDLPRGASPARLLHLLVEGPLRTRAVTLPEGWTAPQVVATLADSLDVERAALDLLVREPLPTWRERLDLPAGVSLEGYLFPETYRFARGVGPDHRRRDSGRGLRERWRWIPSEARLEASGFGLHEWVTLASIVEAEVTVDDEFRRVAAVYLNRLERGWRLEADPTVAYAVGKIGDRLTYGDLETESPYNTYRVHGLPPGPINNPGGRPCSRYCGRCPTSTPCTSWPTARAGIGSAARGRSTAAPCASTVRGSAPNAATGPVDAAGPPDYRPCAPEEVALAPS